ncbi:MAG: class I SAM-dependent methyltransferase [Bacteroidota bacterium]
MKNKFKKLLRTIGLLDLIRIVYHSLQSFSPRVFLDEYSYRRKGLPDGYPAPPLRLIFLIIGLPWVSVYYYSGKEIFDDMKALLGKNKIDIRSFNSILDFGCGCGRIIRHFLPHSNAVHLHGSDYNPELIRWCSANLPFAKFHANTLAPPLSYENSMFDFLYARSVFTHLSVELQKKWTAEFHRVLRKGGYIYLTTHGESTFSKFTPAEKAVLEHEGILTLNQNIEGDNKCATYQTKKFLEDNLLSGFELVDYMPGGKNANQKQDVYLLRKI